MTADATLTTRMQSDVTTAMKSGDKDRVGALRLVLSELLKDAKEGTGDEVAVLRRERKRRIEAATQFREAGRDELAATEEAEAEMISGYLPAEMSDDELAAIVQRSVAEAGALSMKDMGAAMGVAMGAVAGRADGRRVSQAVKAALSG